MTLMMLEEKNLTAYTTQIVAAHVGCNPTAPSDLPELIRSVHDTLAALDAKQPSGNETKTPESVTAPVPAAPIRSSVKPDYIICLEDGKKLKMLKRYLNTHYGLTPDAYRAKWGLPDDYPMVAPNASKRRSAIAKQNGLGQASR